jgi:hypothetical protein
MLHGMRVTTSPSPARRSNAAPLPPELRAELGAAVAASSPERVAVNAAVSLITVRRAIAGAAVRPVVREALVRAARSPAVAA